MSNFLKPFEEKMQERIDYLQEELKTIRAGRANPAILDKITVSYYGQDTPLNQVSSISVPEARLLLIQPWDASLLAEIEKSIQAANIGLNPSNDGKVIRLAIPALTEERRKEITKEVSEIGENTKVSIRSIRRDAVDEAKAQEKSSQISEDELRTIEKQIQDMTDDFTNKVDQLVEEKSQEIMEI